MCLRRAVAICVVLSRCRFQVRNMRIPFCSSRAPPGQKPTPLRVPATDAEAGASPQNAQHLIDSVVYIPEATHTDAHTTTHTDINGWALSMIICGMEASHDKCRTNLARKKQPPNRRSATANGYPVIATWSKDKVTKTPGQHTSRSWGQHHWRPEPQISLFKFLGKSTNI